MRTSRLIGGRTLWLMLGASLATVSVVLLVACGGDGDPEAAATAHTHEDDDHDVEEALRELSGTEEFQEAVDRMVACMAEAGYDVEDPEGVLLSDGTRLPRGRSYTVTPAIAAYRSEQDRCDEESGMADLMAEVGGQPRSRQETPPDIARQQNENALQVISCLEERGWTIPEPIDNGGILVFGPDPGLSDDERAAYDLDYNECLGEAVQ